MAMQAEQMTRTVAETPVGVRPGPGAHPQHYSGTARKDQPADAGTNGLARGLGLFSLGLGLAGVVRPGGLARFAGIDDSGLERKVLGGVGLREIASGVGILAQGQPAPWVWARVAGDLMDVGFVGFQLASGRAKHRPRATAALAGLAGIAALDAFCAAQLSAKSNGARGVAGTKSVTIRKSPEELYAFWRNFENLPRFMYHLESVRADGDRRSHWVAKSPTGGTVEWDAEVVEDRPNELIGWRSLAGSEVNTSGWVRFQPAPGDRGTEVVVEVRYEPPAGGLGWLFAKMVQREPVAQVLDDLRRFKALMETGDEPIRSDATRDGNGMPQPPARPAGE